MENLHYIQMQILRELLFKTNASFKDINVKDLDSEQISYHVRTLIEQGYVSKDANNKYNLTTKGKQFAADIDVTKSQIEDRAKLSIVCIITREKDGHNEVLIIERKKAPQKGVPCFIAGKIKYGDSAEDTVRREVLEEVGLQVTNLTYICFFREFVHAPDGSFLKDNSFLIFHSTEVTGELQESEESKPMWVSEKEFYQLKKAYDIDDIYAITKKPPHNRYIEKDYVTKDF